MYNAIICRYHEIAIKGGNRNMFENRMIDSLYRLLKQVDDIKISRIRGRIWIEHCDRRMFSLEELSTIQNNLKLAFGLESFSPVIMCEPNPETLKKVVANSCSLFFERAFASRQTVSFRIRARRSDKRFALRSSELEIALADVIGTKFESSRLEVNLDHADVTVWCEVREEFAFVYYKVFRAPGGLPAGCNAPVLALLSGGIDSPVACLQIIKRGCRVDFITFHSFPYTPQETVDKVKRIATILNHYQQPGKLFVCNLSEIQKLIRDRCDPRMRTVLYRRMMFRIAQTVAEKNSRQALVTGESVGQVASQTITNLATISRASDMLVLRPLAGMDKNETIDAARQFGTFEIAKEQVPDSCTVFAPSNPATAVPLQKILKEECKISEYPELLQDIINKIEIAICVDL